MKLNWIVHEHTSSYMVLEGENRKKRRDKRDYTRKRDSLIAHKLNLKIYGIKERERKRIKKKRNKR